MTHFDHSSADRLLEMASPATAAPVFANAATPEQAAALYDEQTRQAAALGGNFAALPALSARSLDDITRAGDCKLARSRIKLAPPPQD